MAINWESLRGKMPKGLIVLFTHGWNGNEGTFSNYQRMIEEKNSILDAKTYSDHLYYGDASNPILDDLALNKANYTEKTIFIRTRFENTISGDLAPQSNEIATMISKIQDALGTFSGYYKFLLIGHSKGGLSNMKYLLNYTGRTIGAISVCTPYQGLLAEVQMGWTITDINISPQIFDLRTEWNKKSKKPRIVAYGARFDGIMPSQSALGKAAWWGTAPMFWFRKYDDIERRLEFEPVTTHVSTLENETCLYSVLEQVLYLFNSAGSSGGSATGAITGATVVASEDGPAIVIGDSEQKYYYFDEKVINDLKVRLLTTGSSGSSQVGASSYLEIKNNGTVVKNNNGLCTLYFNKNIKISINGTSYKIDKSNSGYVTVKNITTAQGTSFIEWKLNGNTLQIPVGNDYSISLTSESGTNNNTGQTSGGSGTGSTSGGSV